MDIIIVLTLIIIAISLVSKGKITIEIIRKEDTPFIKVETDLEPEDTQDTKRAIDNFVNDINDLMGVNHNDNEV